MKKLLCFLFFSVTAQAKDLGSFGHTFPIAEENLLSVIQLKLKKLEDSGALEAHQKNIQAQVAKRLQRPLPVKDLIKTKRPRVFTFDPSITVPYDLKDHKGEIFFKAGTKVNPLDTHFLKYLLLFIDSDDKAQVKWAMSHKAANKIILVNGSPFELMKDLMRPVFFDQGGTLSKKFEITQVPARVSQEGKYLKIEEVFCEEENKS